MLRKHEDSKSAKTRCPARIDLDARGQPQPTANTGSNPQREPALVTGLFFRGSGGRALARCNQPSGIVSEAHEMSPQSADENVIATANTFHDYLPRFCGPPESEIDSARPAKSFLPRRRRCNITPVNPLLQKALSSLVLVSRHPANRRSPALAHVIRRYIGIECAICECSICECSMCSLKARGGESDESPGSSCGADINEGIS